MKKINPTARYFETNEWALQEQDYFLVGITDFAQTVFGNVTFIELPQMGQRFLRGSTFAVTESNKAANEISIPLSGTIIAVNQQLIENPIWLNEDPYGKGWLVKIKVKKLEEWNDLMTAAQYHAFIGVFFNKTS